VIEIKEEVQIGNVILEVGDRIEVLKEMYNSDYKLSVDDLRDLIFNIKDQSMTIGDFRKFLFELDTTNVLSRTEWVEVLRGI